MSERIAYEETPEGLLYNIDGSLLSTEERVHLNSLKQLINKRNEYIKIKIKLDERIHNCNPEENNFKELIESRDDNQNEIDILNRQINILIQKEPLCHILEREQKKLSKARADSYRNIEISRMESIEQKYLEERQYYLRKRDNMKQYSENDIRKITTELGNKKDALGCLCAWIGLSIILILMIVIIKELVQ